MAISGLSYIGVRSDRAADWSRFACDQLGMQTLDGGAAATRAVGPFRAFRAMPDVFLRRAKYTSKKLQQAGYMNIDRNVQPTGLTQQKSELIQARRPAVTHTRKGIDTSEEKPFPFLLTRDMLVYVLSI